MAPVHVETATSLVMVGAEYEHQQTVVVQSISGARPRRVRYKVGAKYELAPDYVGSATWLAPNTNIGEM